MVNLTGVPKIKYADQPDLKVTTEAVLKIKYPGPPPLFTQTFDTINGEQWCTSMTITFAVPPQEKTNG